jgi:membrane fusion protein, heavy metal efflux system
VFVMVCNALMFFVRGALALALSTSVLCVYAQGLPLLLNVKQQASLGVQVAAVQASTGGQLLASATVAMPPGKEFTVSAPYAGQVSRLLAGVGDTVKAGAALAHFTSPNATKPCLTKASSLRCVCS